jgi:hypothetical protein
MAFSNFVKLQIPAEIHVLSITEKRNLAKNLSFLEILIFVLEIRKYLGIGTLLTIQLTVLSQKRTFSQMRYKHTETEQKISHM